MDNMSKLLKNTIISFSLATIGLTALNSTAQAGRWIPIIDDVHRCVHGGCDPVRALKKYKFSIYNRTSKSIHYSINGKPELLFPGKGYIYTYKQFSKPIINFDSSYRRGFQTRKYSLGNGTFYFKKVGSTEIDLQR